MSQKGKVLKHLTDYRTITSYEAFKTYSILRLGAIIYELRFLGYDIRGYWVQNGDKRYYEYKLVGKGLT